jgi:hypothetical protein
MQPFESITPTVADDTGGRSIGAKGKGYSVVHVVPDGQTPKSVSELPAPSSKWPMATRNTKQYQQHTVDAFQQRPNQKVLARKIH